MPFEALLNAADQALYQAKSQGRAVSWFPANRIEVGRRVVEPKKPSICNVVPVSGESWKIEKVE
jgi:hypothetical protein